MIREKIRDPNGEFDDDTQLGPFNLGGIVRILNNKEIEDFVIDHEIHYVQYLDNMYNHGGALDGWKSAFCILPEHDTGMLVRTNTGTTIVIPPFWGRWGICLEVAEAWKVMKIAAHDVEP